jgi:hypothetical protein
MFARRVQAWWCMKVVVWRVTWSLPPLVCCVSPGVVTLFQVSRETFRRVVGDPEELLKADPEAHKRYVSIKL